MKETVELKKQVTKEIIQTVLVPVFSSIGFFIWIYFFIKARPEKISIFPLSSIILIPLYFLSGSFYSGIMLGFLTLIGFLSVVLTSSNAYRLAFILEIIWFWGLFFLLEHYQRSHSNEKNRVREENDVLETKISIVNSAVEENVRECSNLKQRISNYQLLGGMVQTLGSTLDEVKIIPLICELATRFVGKGVWKVKKGPANDEVSRYIKENKLPIIVKDMKIDNRFLAKQQKYNSLIAVPLELNEKFWGILIGTELETNAFDESDLRLLSILTGIASLALNNANLYQQTQELAITDGLTGLYVQSYFKERLDEEILRSHNHKLALSLAILDVDHFKAFNDTYGHAAGDAVLCHIATILRRRLRETDLISRYGGEEFSIIMPQTSIKEAMHLTEQIRKSIEKEKFYLPIESFQPVQAKVTISIGISMLNSNINTQSKLLSTADDALYQAKQNGRNRVETSSGRGTTG